MAVVHIPLFVRLVTDIVIYVGMEQSDPRRAQQYSEAEGRVVLHPNKNSKTYENILKSLFKRFYFFSTFNNIKIKVKEKLIYLCYKLYYNRRSD